MTILILYASVEGQTRKIAEFAAKRVRALGHRVKLVNADEKGAEASYTGVDAVILAASIHRRRHPPQFEKFLTAQAPALNRCRTLFLSVSLCAAFPEGHDEAQAYLDDSLLRTGLRPDETELVGGALQYAKYHDYEAQVVRFVAIGLKRYDDIAADREFTDWDALGARIEGFLA